MWRPYTAAVTESSRADELAEAKLITHLFRIESSGACHEMLMGVARQH